MSRRIDIELTSSRDDGTWTWRAAGAKQPKGALAGSLLPDGSTVGDTLRAEVETTLDGTEVLSVAPPKAKSRRADETIEIITKDLRDDELVIETRARRGRRDRDGDRGERRGRRDGERRGRREGGRGDGPRGERGDRRGRRDDDRGTREGRGERDGRGRGRGDRPDRPRRERAPLPPKPKRLRAGRAHRKAVLADLAPEEKVIAEQVLQGGLPAVRTAVEKMNEQNKAQGQPTIKPDALLAVAERLLPALRAAEWRDRADAAVADLDELDLRDLRSVVAAAEQAARDDESRDLANTIREGLARRVDEEQSKWLAEIATNLDEGRVVRALRLSSRPPKPAPLPSELTGRLTEAASAALTADTLVDRWATVLDALQFSPVRLQVTPASKPDAPGEDLIAAVTRVAGRVPKVAEAFGIEATEPAPRRRGKPRRAGSKAAGSPTPTPPPPPAKPAGADDAPTSIGDPSGSSDAPATEESATGTAGSSGADATPAAESTEAATPAHEGDGAVVADGASIEEAGTPAEDPADDTTDEGPAEA